MRDKVIGLLAFLGLFLLHLEAGCGLYASVFGDHSDFIRWENSVFQPSSSCWAVEFLAKLQFLLCWPKLVFLCGMKLCLRKWCLKSRVSCRSPLIIIDLPCETYASLSNLSLVSVCLNVHAISWRTEFPLPVCAVCSSFESHGSHDNQEPAKQGCNNSKAAVWEGHNTYSASATCRPF